MSVLHLQLEYAEQLKERFELYVLLCGIAKSSKLVNQLKWIKGAPKMINNNTDILSVFTMLLGLSGIKVTKLRNSADDRRMLF